MAVLAALLTGACGSSPFELSSTAVADFRARWEAAGIADYEYEYRRQCECLDTRPARIEVRNGRVANATYSDSGEPTGPNAATPTIDDLFDLIESAIRDEAATLRVSYDPRLGYPTQITIDYDVETADDEMEIEASGLVEL